MPPLCAGAPAWTGATQEGNDRGLQELPRLRRISQSRTWAISSAASNGSGALHLTIVIYTTDHGEMGGRHGMFGKSVYFEEAIRVPLLVRLPGRGRGRPMTCIRSRCSTSSPPPAKLARNTHAARAGQDRSAPPDFSARHPRAGACEAVSSLICRL